MMTSFLVMVRRDIVLDTAGQRTRCNDKESRKGKTKKRQKLHNSDACHYQPAQDIRKKFSENAIKQERYILRSYAPVNKMACKPADKRMGVHTITKFSYVYYKNCLH